MVQWRWRDLSPADPLDPPPSTSRSQPPTQAIGHAVRLSAFPRPRSEGQTMPRTRAPEPTAAPMPDLPPEFLSGAHVRRMFGGITDQTLNRWIRAGKIPAPIRIGSKAFWDPR